MVKRATELCEKNYNDFFYSSKVTRKLLQKITKEIKIERKEMYKDKINTRNEQ